MKLYSGDIVLNLANFIKEIIPLGEENEDIVFMFVFLNIFYSKCK